MGATCQQLEGAVGEGFPLREEALVALEKRTQLGVVLLGNQSHAEAECGDGWTCGISRAGAQGSLGHESITRFVDLIAGRPIGVSVGTQAVRRGTARVHCQLCQPLQAGGDGTAVLDQSRVATRDLDSGTRW